MAGAVKFLTFPQKNFVKISFRKFSFILIPLFIFYFSIPVSAQPTNSDVDLGAVIQQYGSLNEGQKNLVLNATGLPQGGDFSMVNLVASLIFGSIGFIAFVYGKKQGAWPPMVIGILLMVYPYFIPGTTLMCVIGFALTAGLYFFRE